VEIVPMTSKQTVLPLDILGNYELLEELGKGGMGRVYKARHGQTGQVVALKVMSPLLARNPVLLKRFEQEFRITSRLDHLNIVRALDFCGKGPTPFLAMEFIEGTTVAQRLEAERQLPEQEAIRIIVQVSHGLHRAHRQGLIHRDIKPENILLTADGTAKITDLGLAKELDGAGELTQTGSGLGTPNFMAPEQFRNAKHADIRSDVYGLGATLYMMVTGKLPFGPKDPVQIMMGKLDESFVPPRQLVPGLSARTERAIRRAMSADPLARPASCREFAEDLLGQSTRTASSAVVELPGADIWYVVYADGDGMVRTVCGTTEVIQRALRGGGLGPVSRARASRSKVGPFEPITGFPEFQDLEESATPPPSTRVRPTIAPQPQSAASPVDAAYLPPPARPQAAPPPAPAVSLPRRKTALEIQLPLMAAPQADAGPLGWAKTLLIALLTAGVAVLANYYLFPLWR
jgi:serine/threonine protein kinase